MIEEICKYEECTGCMACVQCCAHQSIDIRSDKEGFKRPYIIEDKCVECGICVNTCPVNKPIIKSEAIDIYSGWSKDDFIRCNSSSGGAFSEIARPILDVGGVVFGCYMNEIKQAEHIYVENWEDLTKLRGSKYTQSIIGECFKQARTFLKQGREVLFSGTPCQIAGLRNFLRKDYSNLTTVDIICHGVPSPQIFDDYIRSKEEKAKDVVSNINFRSKRFSWKYFGIGLSFKNRTDSYYGAYYDDPYLRGFLRDYFLRPCCSHCQYTSTARVSDFTIADWWGYKPLPGEKDIHKKGVSLVLVNSNHGQQLFKNLYFLARKRTIDEAKKTNMCLYKSFPVNPDRQEFWNDYQKFSFHDMIDKYMFPETITWNVNFLQHHPNTDSNIKKVRFFMLPQRIWNRFLKNK